MNRNIIGIKSGMNLITDVDCLLYEGEKQKRTYDYRKYIKKENPIPVSKRLPKLEIGKAAVVKKSKKKGVKK